MPNWELEFILTETFFQMFLILSDFNFLKLELN